METPKPSMVHVVDDDEAVRDSTRALLESYGIEVCDYASADEFLACDQVPNRGCVLLDLHMPGMSGLELVETLRDRGSNLSIIMLTGRSDPVVKERVIRAGAVTLLDKPVKDDQLLATLARALGRRGLAATEPLRTIP